MCDYILFLRNKIRAIFELEYMRSVFTFVQYVIFLFIIYILIAVKTRLSVLWACFWKRYVFNRVNYALFKLCLQLDDSSLNYLFSLPSGFANVNDQDQSKQKVQINLRSKQFTYSKLFLTKRTKHHLAFDC